MTIVALWLVDKKGRKHFCFGGSRYDLLIGVSHLRIFHADTHGVNVLIAL